MFWWGEGWRGVVGGFGVWVGIEEVFFELGFEG